MTKRRREEESRLKPRRKHDQKHEENPKNSSQKNLAKWKMFSTFTNRFHTRARSARRLPDAVSLRVDRPSVFQFVPRHQT